MRAMTKSAVRVARDALAVGRVALPRYASRYSKHIFAQPQLFALLVLKPFLRVALHVSRPTRRPRMVAVPTVRSREVWGVDLNMIRSAASSAGIELPVMAVRDTAARVYAELHGELAPVSLARWWGSKGDGVPSVLRVSAIPPWTADGC